jgi:HSP20 family molecular chaperone IbpA
MADFDDRLWREFQRLSARLDEWVGAMPAGASLAGPLAFDPRADVCETEGAYLVRVEIPGADPESIHIVLEGHTLFLHGGRPAPRAEGMRVHQMEIAFGAFQKTILLPGPVDPEKISSTYELGMLLLEIAKPESRKIRVRMERS